MVVHMTPFLWKILFGLCNFSRPQAENASEEESTPERVIPGNFFGFKKYDKSIITNYRIVVTVAPFHSHPNMQFSGQ